MAKIYSKSELTFKDGYIINDEDEVVCLPDGVASDINGLEVDLQKMMYLEGQPDAQPEPSLDGFKFESMFDDVPQVKVSTPLLDKQCKQGRMLLDELRKKGNAEAANEFIKMHEAAIRFFASDLFVEGTEIVRLDCGKIGDPLTCDADALVALIAEYV